MAVSATQVKDTKVLLQEFHAPSLLTNPHVQSILASVSFRRRLVTKRAKKFLQQARSIILDCSDNVQLQGFYSEHENSTYSEARPLAILIHGWEGSADSLYILSTGATLYERGYDVFRLNLRDHGDTHHLNEGLFHSCRIEEAVGAIKAIQLRVPGRQTCLAGFSLGGNFALRIAVRANDAGIELAKAIAICPVLNPASTLMIMEQRGRSIYHNYFLQRWLISLGKKHRLFPDAYNLEMIRANKTLRSLTEYLVLAHTGYTDLESYLNGYSIIGDALQDLSVNSHLLLSADDPVIPIEDITNLARPEALSILVTRRGGHCAFLDNYSLTSWMDGVIAGLFDEATNNVN